MYVPINSRRETILSIIMPVYNKELYIDSCITSILSQTFTKFELILIDDGSTDKSSAICDYYKKNDSRIVVIHQTNKGVSTARNVGLSLAKGKYIGFVDCDDTLEEDMYEILIQTIEEHSADISICGVRKIFPNKIELYYGKNEIKKYNCIDALKGLLRKNFPRSVYDKVYKAEIAKNVKFEGSINEDIFYNFLTFSRAETVVYNDIIKYNYIIRENSVSMSKFNNKYMETINFSKKIVEICKEKIPELTHDAKYYDIIMNFSLLNLIITSTNKFNNTEYKKIIQNLYEYSDFIYYNKVKEKYKMALRILKVSPLIYGIFMRIYCKITDADVLRKKTNNFN